MADHPRRLRPSTEKREATSRTTHTSLSGDGSVGAARPVPDGAPRATRYTPPDEGNNVVTGQQGDDSGTSITRTIAGDGNSNAVRPNDIAIGNDAYADGESGTAEGGTGGGAVAIGATDPDSFGVGAIATGRNSVALGGGSEARGLSSLASLPHAQAWGERDIAVGVNARTDGADLTNHDNVAVGTGALADSGSFATALGADAQARASGAVAIGTDHTGTGAEATGEDEFALGTANHIVIIKGKLVMADTSGGLHQIIVSTGGALSTVAYP